MRDRVIMARISALVAEFGRGRSVPEQKFLRDLIFGILCSQSSLLSEIARAVCHRENVQTLHRRLDLNLGRYDLTWAYEKAQNKMLSRIDSSYLLIFDPSEVVKPFAKKMEALHLVRDASEKPRLVKDEITGKRKEVPILRPGYPLRIAVALSSAGNILPVELALYSAASEFFVSRNDEHVYAIDALLQKSRFSATLILDREFDAWVLIRHFCELRQRFIIRIRTDRKFNLPDSGYSPKAPRFGCAEMAEKYAFLTTEKKLVYSENAKMQEHLFSFKAVRVKLLNELKKTEDVRDIGDLDALTLVEMKIHKQDGAATLYLLTTTRPENDDDLVRIGKAYIARWNVEEYIRFLKQNFRLEGFLVRDLGRMKNIMKAVYVATVIMHLLTDKDEKRGRKNHAHLLEKSLEVASEKKFRDFFQYTYARGLAYLVAANKNLLNPHSTVPKKSDNSPRNQLAFSYS